jgi:hypothetical protein
MIGKFNDQFNDSYHVKLFYATLCRYKNRERVMEQFDVFTAWYLRNRSGELLKEAEAG